MSPESGTETLDNSARYCQREWDRCLLEKMIMLDLVRVRGLKCLVCAVSCAFILAAASGPGATLRLYRVIPLNSKKL